MKIIGLVLAAGQGKRMKSKLYKVLHPVCGKPMVGHVLDRLESIQVDRSVVVVGHGAEAVEDYIGDRAEYVLQSEQLGTGHAVMQTKSLLDKERGITIVVCGDTPLITEHSLQSLIKLHQEQAAAATVLTAIMEEPHGYGRVIRGDSGEVLRIVEQKDCSEAENRVQEINTATYCFDNEKLFKALEKVNNNNAQQEYYLTDVISILRDQAESVQAYCLKDHEEALGVNDRLALAEAEAVMRKHIQKRHSLNGVTIQDPANTYIGADVTIGADTTVMPGTHLAGSTVIGEDCLIGPNSEIQDCTIGQGVHIKHSVVLQSKVEDEAMIGPYAHIRPNTKIGKKVKIGDFVEIKNATIDEGSKVSHLSYVGDASIGKDVNIGCGAITVNYDGFNKNWTHIEDGAFVGSNVNLIAPVHIGKDAYVVAGSTITTDVSEGSMAIARSRQTNKAGYAARIRQKYQSKSKE